MQFHHHPDNIIHIEHNGETYDDSLDNFLEDCRSIGIVYTGRGDDEEVQYTRGKGRVSFNGGNLIFHRLVCDECEIIIDKILDLKQAKALRESIKRHDDIANISPEAKKRRAIEKALAYINMTQWMISRSQECNIPVPEEVIDARRKAFDTIPLDYNISIKKERKQ